MNEPEPSSLRIGDVERSAATAALDVHLEAGRLDAAEYGERSARAATARTVDDLRPLFADLPPPHPPQLGGATTTEVSTARAEPAPVAGREQPGGLARWGPPVVGALPIIALVLFLTVPIPHAWVFFLLVPLGGGLLARTRRSGD